MANIFPIDFEEKLTMAQDDYILFSDSEDGNKIKKAQYKNLKGEPGTPGTPGADGEDGAAATITVGTTTTGAAGSSATVVNSGTSSAAVLEFTIPQGAKGEPGEDGDDGAAATITVGTTTTLPAGSSATVTNSGTSSAAVLNFGIPKGDSGEGSGDVVGPASSTDGHIAVFDGATGKIIKDGGAMPTIPTKVSDLTNDSGFITGITSGDVTTALGYTPYNSTNPDGFITSSYHDATKQDLLTAGTNISIENNVISATGGGSDIEYVTQAEYEALLPGALTDNKHYFIYEEEVGPTPTPPFTPGVNTLAYYPLNGDANDYSGNNMNLTTNNLTYSQLNDIQVAVLGDNVSAYYQVGSGFMNGTTNFTFSLYIKYSSIPSKVNIFGFMASNPVSGGSYDKCFQLKSDSSIGFAVYDGDEEKVFTNSSFISTNTWYHICATYDGSTLSFYIDGNLIGSTSASGTYNCDYFTLNTNRTGDNTWINGNMSEIILEDKARTAQEVSDYYDATKSLYGIS